MYVCICMRIYMHKMVTYIHLTFNLYGYMDKLECQAQFNCLCIRVFIVSIHVFIIISTFEKLNTHVYTVFIKNSSSDKNFIMMRKLNLKLKLIIKVKNGQGFSMYYPYQCHRKNEKISISPIVEMKDKGS